MANIKAKEGHWTLIALMQIKKTRLLAQTILK